MNRIRDILLSVLALGAALAGLFLFATIGLAVIGGLAVAAVAGAIVMRFLPARPARRDGMTIRRDARGVIIDM